MQSLPIAVHIVFTPIDDSRNEEPIEILASIKSNKHEDIQATIPPI
jgi:hypothetical protein